MSEEIELIYSDLQTTFSKDGQTVEIQIYRMPDTDWTLEVVDSGNNSTVWEDTFPRPLQRDYRPSKTKGFSHS